MANSSNKSGINLHMKNPSLGLDCSLMCLNGMVGQAYTAGFAIISKTLNGVGSNTQNGSQNGTTAPINMYGATERIGSQDAQIICTGGNSSAVNNGSLVVNSKNFSLDSNGYLQLTGPVLLTGLSVSLPKITPFPSHTPTILNLAYNSVTAAYIDVYGNTYCNRTLTVNNGITLNSTFTQSINGTTMLNVDGSGNITSHGYLICGGTCAQYMNNAKITTVNPAIIDELAIVEWREA